MAQNTRAFALLYLLIFFCASLPSSFSSLSDRRLTPRERILRDGALLADRSHSVIFKKGSSSDYSADSVSSVNSAGMGADTRRNLNGGPVTSFAIANGISRGSLIQSGFDDVASDRSESSSDRFQSHGDKFRDPSDQFEAPSLTIFCAPKPYSSIVDPSDPNPDSQRRALLSWLRLSPPPKVVLFGNDTSFHELARRFPAQISVEPLIDSNFYGVPQFHSMVARAQAAATDISMIINGDIILLNDVMLALQKTHGTFQHWVMTAARWDMPEDFPYSFEPQMWGQRGLARGRSHAAMEEEIREFVRDVGTLHTYGGVDFWAWNNDSPAPLFDGVMPPFSFGRGKYDNWFTHEIVAAGRRTMVDASEAVTAIHVAHSYSHVVESAATKSIGNGNVNGIAAGKNFWSTRKKSSWELFGNIHMAMTHGSYANQKGTALHVPWKLATCHEPSVHNMCLQQRLRPATCTCESANFVRSSQTDPKLDKTGRKWTCGSVSVDRNSDYSIPTLPPPSPASSPVGLPHTMEQLLPTIARSVPDGRGGELQVVTLVAVTAGYAEMLMSFVCRLRSLGLASNLLVAALDEDLYRFAFTQGLPVYYEQVSQRLKGVDSKDCAFGSQCFRQFTKLKSRAVLRVLKAGYSVLWTDVDIVWFTDPLPDLLSYGPGTFPIQSNEPNVTLPGTGIRRINSGFYFARADKKTVAAFEAITAHAATTRLSEQPSFYDILCGVKGENVVEGKEECVWENGLRTIFLDRVVYANGAAHGFWDEEDVEGACRRKGCTILHNNWIAGKDAKKQRFALNSFASLRLWMPSGSVQQSPLLSVLITFLLPVATAAVNKHSQIKHIQQRQAQQQEQQRQRPFLTIFTAPKPYTSILDPSSPHADPQRRALLSWLRLRPSPKIVLLGNDSSFRALARQFPAHVAVESAIDTNFYGVPQVHSVVARAQAADTPVSMVINADIILMNDVMAAMRKVHENFRHWVMTAARWDMPEEFPYSFEREMWAGRGHREHETTIREFVRTHGTLHTYGGVDFWAWNNDDRRPVPLVRGTVPPFSYGRGKYDNWLTHEIISSGLREIVDASEAVTAVHVAHSYSHVMESAFTKNAAGLAGKSFWSTRMNSSWELFANIHLAHTHGTYANQKGTPLHVPIKLMNCLEASANFLCLQRRLRPAACSCDQLPVSAAPPSSCSLFLRILLLGGRLSDGPPHERQDEPVDLLPVLARKVPDGRGGELQVVTLVAVTAGYAEMLMSFVCRLRSLGLASNLLIAALDEDLYRFAFTQGLPVYYEQASEEVKHMRASECGYGSQCFRHFTKLKSRSVLKVLNAGYSVLWTDVDIVWFTDPLPDLLSFGPGTLPIQSNEPDANLPGTGVRRINSGFYFARADRKTIEAFEAITAHAAATKLSEQPSFYDVLCGEAGELVAAGREECVWKNGLRTVFLDRARYPNGAVHGLWEQKNVHRACAKVGCSILHNNWISGREEKMRRFLANDMWHYDADRRMCVWEWHGKVPELVRQVGGEGGGRELP
ncbi:unnamed protein product [Closterium sp. Naga37s-1]|nr:unnamed protein product [Closterium sp. Naga37s-1]